MALGQSLCRPCSGYWLHLRALCCTAALRIASSALRATPEVLPGTRVHVHASSHPRTRASMPMCHPGRGSCAQAAAAYHELLASGAITAEETTVVVLTGTGLKATPRIAELLGVAL